MDMDVEEPVRVLQVLGTTNLGGAESRVMELYRAMDRTKVQFDFLVHTDSGGYYDDEIRELGGEIYSVPRFRVYNTLSYKKALKKFFDEHGGYAAVHGHMTSTASIYLPIAKEAGIPLTIAHARSAGVDPGPKGLVTKFLRRDLKHMADYCFACSTEAGEAVYGKKWMKEGEVWIIPNAIDARRFGYNGDVRAKMRSELKLYGKFAIGHVGRFSFMKNHEYLVQVFAWLCKMRDDAVLVMVGGGGLEDKIKDQVRRMGLADKVIFTGNRSDVERYYMAFDYFVFPSTFEGFPGSVAEAQASGLRCLVSDRVTREVALTELVSYKSIDESPASWAAEIMRNAKSARERCDMSGEIVGKDFDVRGEAAKMAEFYISGQNPPGKRTYG